ncbi:MAG: hypothetical protein CMF50_04115 [Legionellales bacterium]|nr:hypothetical protein [Legionellales bacterium]|tara:strand:- start:17420 stop:17608 length:189 start_codon:yes stop_codon:yes gene_type:complete
MSYLDTLREEGYKEGIELSRHKVAQNMLLFGLDDALIREVTAFPQAELETLKVRIKPHQNDD